MKMSGKNYKVPQEMLSLTNNQIEKISLAEAVKILVANKVSYKPNEHSIIKAKAREILRVLTRNKKSTIK